MAWPADWAHGEVITGARQKQWTDAQKVWPGNVSAGGYNLSSMGVLSFGAAGYIAAGAGVGGAGFAAWKLTARENLYLRRAEGSGHAFEVGVGGTMVVRYKSDVGDAIGGADPSLYITHEGKVGINKAAPGTKFAVVGLPTYAGNTAATGGGLTAGDCYRTSAGVVMVVY